jgi:hypothetical protein
MAAAGRELIAGKFTAEALAEVLDATYAGGARTRAQLSRDAVLAASA